MTVWLVLARPNTFDQLVDTFTTFGDLSDAQSRHQLAVDALTAPWPLVAQLAAGGAMVALLFAAVRSGPGERFARVRPAFPALLVLVAAAPLVAFGPLPNGTREVTALSSAGTPFMTAAHEAGPYRMATLNPPGYYVGMPDQPAANGVADLRMFSSLNLRATDEVVALAVRDDADGQAIRRLLGVDTVVTFAAPCPGVIVSTSGEDKATFCRDEAALRPPWWVPSAAVPAWLPSTSPIRPTEASLDVGRRAGFGGRGPGRGADVDPRRRDRRCARGRVRVVRRRLVARAGRPRSMAPGSRRCGRLAARSCR